MLYRPPLVDMLKVDRENFTVKRWIRLPSRIFLEWIKTPGGLREPTAVPFVWDRELKEGFYWTDLIH